MSTQEEQNNKSSEIAISRITEDLEATFENLGITPKGCQLFKNLDDMFVRLYMAVCLYLKLPIEYNFMDSMYFSGYDGDPIVDTYHELFDICGGGRLELLPERAYEDFREATELYSEKIYKMISEKINSNCSEYDVSDEAMESMDMYVVDDIEEEIKEKGIDPRPDEESAVYKEMFERHAAPFKTEAIMNIFNALLRPPYIPIPEEETESVLDFKNMDFEKEPEGYKDGYEGLDEED